jgi:RND family efflux transporter MFP subunit
MLTLNNKIWKYQLIFLLGSVILFSGCSFKRGEKDTAENQAKNLSKPQHLHLTPEAIKTAGVKVSELGPVKIENQLGVPGEIVLNPKKYYRLASRVPGRVEELLAYEGDRVKKGQVVAKLFSLQFMQEITELRLAKERWEKAEKLGQEEKATALLILNSVIEKLKILGIDPQEIEPLLSIGSQNMILFPVISPIDGQIITTKVFNGDNIETGTLLMEIANLDEVWIEVHVQEKDIRMINPGQKAVIRVNAYPDESFSGLITYVSPVMDNSTRTIKARITVDNKQGILRPGMYIEAKITIPETNLLAIPEEAVQEISGKKVVFIPESEGTYGIREVKTGEAIKGWLPIIDGLSAGDKYVCEGSFILKSELLKNTLGEE